MLWSQGEDIDGMANCTADYLDFNIDIIIPTATVHCFPNNKPWITGNVEAHLNQKKRSLKD